MNDVHEPDARLALAAAGLAAVPEHVAVCEHCSTGLASLRSLVEALRALPDPPERLVDGALAAFRSSLALERLLERLAAEPLMRRRAARDAKGVLAEFGLPATPELVALLTQPSREQPATVARRLAARAFRG